MNGAQFHSSSTQASAAPASTGMTEAVKANGRRISYSAPSRRRVRSPPPRSRSSARVVVAARPRPP